jgi:hypothetical protein
VINVSVSLGCHAHDDNSLTCPLQQCISVYLSHISPRSVDLRCILHVTNIRVPFNECCSEHNISSDDPYARKLLTFLHHPGHKAWLASSLRPRENAAHPESTSNRGSKPPSVRASEDNIDVAWTNVVTLCWLPRLERLTSMVHASKVP